MKAALPAPIEVLASCTACGACLLTCPEQALLPAPGRPLLVTGRCTTCGECIEICPRGALVEVRP
jgi:Pyruvate/2-oxoacid:ferredoxin oxidoreductase delta subunit